MLSDFKELNPQSGVARRRIIAESLDPGVGCLLVNEYKPDPLLNVASHFTDTID